MAKTSISGFPEWLPAEQAVENALLSNVREAFRLFGFCDVVSRGVEPVSALLAKGETSKEIYLLSRLQEAFESESGEVNLREKLSSPKQLGLHFDLTVPFARYVQENAGELQFPFRRSSIGKVWRGERPQTGRFREFTQADVDIVARALPENGASENSSADALPLFNDVDIVKAVDFALKSVFEEFADENANFKYEIHLNNRKLLQGAYEYFGVKDFESTMRILDKIAKIGNEGVIRLLLEAGESAEIADKCIGLAEICVKSTEELHRNGIIGEIAENSTLAKTGLDELAYLLERTENTGNTVADLSITRGLDYYTGSVFETFISGREDFGSIASGGRYDNLVSSLSGSEQSNKKAPQFPGVGMSIGVTRLVSFFLAESFQSTQDFQQAEILVTVNSEETREDSVKIADRLRNEGRSAFVSPTSAKLGKQIDFAEKRGIPFVVFLDENFASSGRAEIKDIRSGEQRAL